jgi:hypothetical protein
VVIKLAMTKPVVTKPGVSKLVMTKPAVSKPVVTMSSQAKMTGLMVKKGLFIAMPQMWVKPRKFVKTAIPKKSHTRSVQHAKRMKTAIIILKMTTALRNIAALGVKMANVSRQSAMLVQLVLPISRNDVKARSASFASQSIAIKWQHTIAMTAIHMDVSLKQIKKRTALIHVKQKAA